MDKIIFPVLVIALYTIILIGITRSIVSSEIVEECQITNTTKILGTYYNCTIEEIKDEK